MPEQNPEPTSRLVRIAERLFGVPRLDSIVESAERREVPTLYHAVREEMQLRSNVAPDAAARIPSAGPLIVVSNHPTGAMEAILLFCFLFSIREDIRILAHVWFRRYPGLARFMFPIDPTGGPGHRRLNLKATRNAVEWVKSGKLLVTYPAGGVAHLHRRPLKVMDPEWHPGTARIVRRAGAPVVPVEVDGRNSALFQLVSLVHPMLRAPLLARELIGKCGTTQQMRVGKPIPFDRLARLESDEELVKQLRRAVLSNG